MRRALSRPALVLPALVPPPRRRWLGGAAVLLAGPVLGLADADAQADPGRSADASPPISRWPAPWRLLTGCFGGPAELLLDPAEGQADAAAALLAQVHADWQRLHRDWHAWRPGALGRLNAALAAGRSAEVDPALAALLRQAQELEAASAGGFNPAIGAAVRAWGFHEDPLPHGRPPPPAAWLARWPGRGDRPPALAALDFIGPGRVASRDPRVQLDLGACGKGAAAARALELVRAAGRRAALVDLAGNLAAVGVPGGSGGQGWRIGLRDPRGPGLLGQLTLGEGREAVIGAGIHERRRRLPDGRWIGHLIEPASGRPVDGLAGVTVVHPDPVHADAAATALMVAGPTRWAEVAREMAVDQVLVVESEPAGGRVHVTPALARRLSPVPSPGA